MSALFVHEWFAQRAAAHPDAPAIESGGRTIAYGVLDHRANALASALAAAAPPGTPVGILTSDRLLVITAMIATLKAGCAFVPMDPANGDARLALLAGAVDLAWWITDAQHLPRLGAIADRTGRPLRALCVTSSGGDTRNSAVECTAVDIEAEAPPCL